MHKSTIEFDGTLRNVNLLAVRSSFRETEERVRTVLAVGDCDAAELPPSANGVEVATAATAALETAALPPLF